MALDLNKTESTGKKRKADSSAGIKIIAECTLRQFEFYYFHINLITTQHSSKGSEVDALTIQKHFTTAMAQRFGVMGSAVPMDLLKLEAADAWIRVPFNDRIMVTEALSGWIGNSLSWRIKNSGTWLGGMITSDGRDLFDD